MVIADPNVHNATPISCCICIRVNIRVTDTTAVQTFRLPLNTYKESKAFI